MEAKGKVDILKELYPSGTMVKLIEMSGEDLPHGLVGTVVCVDDIGQIHVNWENGSSLALNHTDDFVVIKKGEKKNG